MALDSKMLCLCCNKIVLVDSGSWGKMEMPIALCPTCATTVPRAVLHALFVIRSQVATTLNETTLLKKDISKLYQAQKELEQALVQEA